MIGTRDRGHLGEGALADIAVYADRADRTEMFARADLVFKSGKLVVENGDIIASPSGKRLHAAAPYDANITTRLRSFHEDLYGLSHEHFSVPADLYGSDSGLEQVPCRI